MQKKYEIPSLVLGIVSLCLFLLSFFWIPALIGLVLAIIGMIFAKKAKKQGVKSKIAKGGFVTSLIGIILCGIMSLVMACPFLMAIHVLPYPSTDNAGESSKYNLKNAKTCTIEDVSFQYPANWQTHDFTEDNVKNISFFDWANGSSTQNSQNKLVLSVSIVGGVTKKPWLQYFEETADDFQRLENINVAGQICYHIKSEKRTDNSQYCEYYFFDSPKGVIEISSGQEDALQILPDILKTVTIEQ